MSIDSLTTTAALAAQMGPDEAALRRKDMDEAAVEFEGYLVEMMIREMRSTIPEGMFQSDAVDLFSGIFDQELSKSIASSGGIGLASLLTSDSGQRPTPHVSTHAAPVRMVPHEAGISQSRSDSGRWSVEGKLPVAGVVTSAFGRRSDPFHGRNRAHKGIDIAAPAGTPVHPVRPGTVVSAERRGGYGNVVVLDHGDGTTSLYAHCNELKVQKGDKVALGDVIATVGSTGRSTGPHLHLEIHRDGRAVDPVDALGWNRENRQPVAHR